MPANHQISLNTVDAIHLIHLKDILYCKSNNSYTTFYLTNHKPIKVSQSIKQFEEQLKTASFVRSHQSYLVNTKHVIEVCKTNNYSILLSDNSIIPTSTRKRKSILQILLNK